MKVEIVKPGAQANEIQSLGPVWSFLAKQRIQKY